jgi:ADP-ribose pyrophosphatase YjhB (NUDIX family)
MKNYFQGNKDHPYHISVGGVVLNGKNEIMVHHFEREDLPGYWPDLGINDFYILMRETINPNETLEEALHRGLMEEFGVRAELLDYIGSVQCEFRSAPEQPKIQKTTLYFLCKFIDQDLSKRSGEDIEGKTKIEWHTRDFLIPKMKEQALKYDRADIDESSILEKISM